MCQKKKFHAVVGLAVDPEQVFLYDSKQPEPNAKLYVRDHSVGLAGSSGDVARGLKNLGFEPLLLGLSGHEESAADHLLNYATKASSIHYKAVRILDKTSHSMLRADVSMQEKGMGRRYDIKAQYLEMGVIDVKKYAFESQAEIAIATGVRPGEISIVKAMFAHSPLRVLVPNASLAADKKVFEDILSETNILIMNQLEAEGYFGTKNFTPDDLKMLHGRKGPDLIIITRDESGGTVSLMEKDSMIGWYYDAIKMPYKELFPQGAGDWFVAGFIAHYLSSELKGVMSKQQVNDCIDYAKHVAVLKITFPGAANGPSLDQVKEFIVRGK